LAPERQHRGARSPRCSLRAPADHRACGGRARWAQTLVEGSAAPPSLGLERGRVPRYRSVVGYYESRKP